MKQLYIHFFFLFFFFSPEMMDSSTFKRFTASIENILENLEDMDFTALGNMSEIFKLLPQIETQQKPKNLHFSIFRLPSD